MAAELLELGVLFSAVAIVGWLSDRLQQSVIPFYIVVGILLGPHVAGTLTYRHLGEELAVGASVAAANFVALGAELGIVFLLFFLGLEFNLDRLLANRGRISRAGSIDLFVNFGAGLLLGILLFDAFLPAFIVAGMVYISSSAIITKALIDRGWIANPESEPMLSILVYEDLFIAVYLAVLSALVIGSGNLADAATDLSVAMGSLVALLLFAYLGTSLLNRTLATNSNEFMILRVSGVTILLAGAALALGVSEAVAAFFVGMAFSSTRAIDDIERLLEPLRDIFGAVFFFWIGTVTDPTILPAVAIPVAIAVSVTTPTKFASGFWGGKIFGLNDRRATRVGLGMVTRGEFTLVIASIVIGATGAIPQSVANQLNAFAVGYVLVMSVLGTSLMQFSGVLETRVARWRAAHPLATENDP